MPSLFVHSLCLKKKKEAKTLFCFWYVFLWFSCIAQLHYSFEWFPRLNIYRSWFYNTVDWLWRLVTCMQLVSKLMFLTLNNCLLLISCPVILNSKVWPCFTANIHCVALQAVCLNMTPQEEKKNPTMTSNLIDSYWLWSKYNDFYCW